MRETVNIDILCPVCGNALLKSRYASKGKWVTWWRIRCPNKECDIDTGEQPTMSHAYEALMVFYFGAESKCAYKHDIESEELIEND